jgi:prolyl oligopeptidase
MHLLDWELPEMGTITALSGRREYGELFYAFTSFLHPPTIYRYNEQGFHGQTSLYRASEAKFDSTPFETQQIFVTSKDGTRIPLFVTHKKGLKLDGSNPSYLTAYGGFKISETPGFSPIAAAWLEAGDGGGKPTSKIIEEEADKWAFIMHALGMDGAP